MNNKLTVNQELVDRCRSAARRIGDDVFTHIRKNSTDSVERTVLRLMGIDGTDSFDVPLPNRVVNHLREKKLLASGAAGPIINASLLTGKSPQELAEAVAAGDLDLSKVPPAREEARHREGDRLAAAGIERIADRRREREDFLKEHPPGAEPWCYVIVATGNIHEDVVQARSAAAQGADVIAVIRTTAQSLLDYVPYGATTEGFGGTYATQENFRIMREALDESSREEGRYIRLVNYASGLCMPEIAVMGAFERLDMMLNDAIYGILFRDINMKRTLVDQHFSRMINALAGIVINTGEDNYLTTSDAVEEAHTVLASQFINEDLARRSGLPASQMGLGHAFEINPDLEDGFLMELAQAQLVRQIFPDAPIKYMPPTKYKTGDIFKGHLMDGMFNLSAIITGQSIQLLGMLTEAVHTPFMQDRALALENARHIFNTARHLGEEIEFRSDGRIQKRADQVLDEAAGMVESIAGTGLMASIANGVFASISRPVEGGKGADGVFARAGDYYNPFEEAFENEL